MTNVVRLRDERLDEMYRAVFDTPAGRRVLDDLERVANLTKIDSDHPDPHAAIYRVAQLALVQRIRKRLAPANELNGGEMK